MKDGYISKKAHHMGLPPIHLLLRTVLENPLLALKIKNVRFHGLKLPTIYHTTPSVTSDQNGQSQADLYAVLRLVKLAGLPAKPRSGVDETWIGEAVNGNAELYQALFISQLHNVEALAIGFDDASPLLWLSAIFSHILCSGRIVPATSQFCRLRRVELCNDMVCRNLAAVSDSESGRILSSVLLSLALPNIQDLRAVFPGIDTDSDPSHSSPWLLPSSGTMLTRLHLRRSELKPRSLGGLLALTPQLVHLKYDLCRVWMYPIAPMPTLDCSALTEVFDHVANTLKSLVLCLQILAETEIDDISAVKGLGISGNTTFARLTYLVELEAPLIALLGSSSIPRLKLISQVPRGLEKPSVRDDLAHQQIYHWRSHETLDCMEEFAENMSGMHSLETLERVLSESGRDQLELGLSDTCYEYA